MKTSCDGSDPPRFSRRKRLQGYFTTKLPAWHFDIEAGKRRLLKQLGAGTLAGFGVEDMTLAIGACGALLEYAAKTQGQALAHVTAVTAERAGEYLRLDAATRRNLELTETLRGEPAPTLFSLLDECACGMGSRLLRHWLHHPLRDRKALEARHQAVACLEEKSGNVHKVLRGFSDVERITSRVALRNVRPRELAGLRDSLGLLPALQEILPAGSAILEEMRQDLAVPLECLELLRKAVHPEPAARVIDGGVIADGYRPELDELRGLQANAGEFLVLWRNARRSAPGSPTCASHTTRYTATTSRSRTPMRQGAGRLPPPPDAEKRRALHHAGAEGIRGQGAVGARPRPRAGEVAV